MLVFSIDPETGKPVILEEDMEDDDYDELDDDEPDEDEQEVLEFRRRELQDSEPRDQNQSPTKVYKTPAKERRVYSEDKDQKSGNAQPLLHSGEVLGNK